MSKGSFSIPVTIPPALSFAAILAYMQLASHQIDRLKTGSCLFLFSLLWFRCSCAAAFILDAAFDVELCTRDIKQHRHLVKIYWGKLLLLTVGLL